MKEIDEAIQHCLEVAEENEDLSSKFDEWDDWEKADADNCRECAADHRQLAEWLTKLKELEAKHWDECRQIAHYDDELKEAKRLLKAAVDDMRDVANNDTCNHCVLDGLYIQGGCCADGCFKWRYADEALKLIES